MSDSAASACPTAAEGHIRTGLPQVAGPGGHPAPPAPTPGGQLAAMVAHELNTPLQAICNLLFLAERKFSPPESYIPQVRAEVDRLNLFLERLLTFAQPDALPCAVSANEVVERALALLVPLLARRRMAVARELAAGLPPVFGDAGALAQTLFDLLLMLADEAAGNGLRVRSGLRSTPAGVAVRLQLSAGRPVAGERQGAPAGQPARRLDLRLGRAVIARFGGTITIQRRQGHGPVVTILLPAAGP